MRLTIAFLLLALTGAPGFASAQKVVPGGRAPELKIQSWIDNRTPAPAALTYVEFFHSTSKASQESVVQLKKLAESPERSLRIVVIVRDDDQRAAALLRPSLSKQLGAGIDPAGRIFAAYGVNYIPFGVLLDSRNRVLWMGNSRQLTPEIIEKSK